MKKLGYLSGAPRVSTRPETELLGPRAHVIGVMKAFSSLGWQINPFVVGDRVPLSWIRNSGRSLEASWFKRLAADGVRIGMSSWNSYRAFRELGNSVDWVYERLAVFQCLGYSFKKRGIPWILETNGLLYQEAQLDRKSITMTSIAKSREMMAYKLCDVVVTVSTALKNLVVDSAQVNPNKVVVVPNGVDTYRFDPTLVSPIRAFQGPTIGFVGHLFSWQALDYLMRAVAELLSEGIRWNVVIIGDGPLRMEWEELARSLSLEHHVRFIGRIPWDEVPAWISGFDLCYSGHAKLGVGQMYHSPLKLYEYMAMGKPVVASAFEDAQKIVCHGETGFLFEHNSSDSLCGALRSAWEQQPYWRHMGESARSLIVKHHSWEQRVRGLVSEVEEILCSKMKFTGKHIES